MKKELLRLHFLIAVLAFTGLLGDIIVVDAFQLVWFRTLFASIGLFAILILFKRRIKLATKNILIYLGIGITIGLHWICFFHSIDISTISLGVGCLASASIFTSILEPLHFGRRVLLSEVVISLMVIVGLYIIFQFEFRYSLGILFATTSAFLGAWFTVLNKKYIKKEDDMLSITFYEILGAFLTVAIIQWVRGEHQMFAFELSTNDWICILILALICTCWAFWEQVYLVKYLSAFVIVLSFNLEPVYGMLIGALMGEEMTSGFYLGAGLILFSIAIYPIVKNKHFGIKKRKEVV